MGRVDKTAEVYYKTFFQGCIMLLKLKRYVHHRVLNRQFSFKKLSVSALPLQEATSAAPNTGITLAY